MRNGKEIRNIYPFILLIFVFYIYVTVKVGNQEMLTLLELQEMLSFLENGPEKC